jgi:Ca2+-binding EF-hand superfamily protein
MTSRILTPIAAAVAVVAVVALSGPMPVRAQPRKGAPRCMPPHVKKLLPTYDANKNGKLERSERRAMRQGQRKADFTKYDKDKNGKLSPTERKALRWDKLVQHFGELDTNKNGTISTIEAKGSCTPIERRFLRIDRDNSGTITWTEFERAAPRRFPPPHGHHGQHPPPRRP